MNTTNNTRILAHRAISATLVSCSHCCTTHYIRSGRVSGCELPEEGTVAAPPRSVELVLPAPKRRR